MLRLHLYEVQHTSATMFSVRAHRKPILRSCAAAIARRLDLGGGAGVVTVCTHNSRRSQLAEVWLTVALQQHGLSGVRVASGGTEVTAVAPGISRVLAARGFVVSADYRLANPRVAVSGHGINCVLWSKSVEEAISQVASPRGAVALMVCAAADNACPMVAGASYRSRLPYDDPKIYDDTLQEAQAYLQTSNEIEAEMMWMVRQLIIK